MLANIDRVDSMFSKIKNYIPWWAKIAVKLMLSKLPASYAVWKKVSMFEHGYMDRPSYAYKVFKQHFELSQPKQEFVSLELGPGDSLFSSIISKSFGGSKSYLVDSGDYALKDVEPYKNMAKFISENDLCPPNISNLQSIEEILARCSALYMTSGLSSLKAIPDKSIDFIWSQAVLEHIRLEEFVSTIQELRRIITDDGVCSHEIDLRDHLGGGLNNLRFPKNIWESNFMARSGFYTNRLRYSEILNVFQQAYFDCKVIEVHKWDRIPIQRAKLAKEFVNFSDEDICISVFSVILRPI